MAMPVSRPPSTARLPNRRIRPIGVPWALGVALGGPNPPSSQGRSVGQAECGQRIGLHRTWSTVVSCSAAPSLLADGRTRARLLALLDATRYSATYKLATLLALMDVVAEHTDSTGSAPQEVSANEVARRVIELYWPQTVPYGAPRDGEPKVLMQAPQNDIPAKLARWRSTHGLGAGASVEQAAQAEPAGWATRESELIAIVIGMPLAKLQRFGEG